MTSKIAINGLVEVPNTRSGGVYTFKPDYYASSSMTAPWLKPR